MQDNTNTTTNNNNCKVHSRNKTYQYGIFRNSCTFASVIKHKIKQSIITCMHLDIAQETNKIPFISRNSAQCKDYGNYLYE